MARNSSKRSRTVGHRTADPPESPPTETTDRLREQIEESIGPVVGGSQREQVVERVRQLIAAELFRGPLPHPRHLGAYEEVCPGAADRIIRMAEIAQQRRDDRNDELVKLEYGDRRLGMKLGFSALVIMLVSGAIMTAIGDKVIGGGLITAAVIGTVVGSFIDGRIPRMRKKEKENSPDT